MAKAQITYISGDHITDLASIDETISDVAAAVTAAEDKVESLTQLSGNHGGVNYEDTFFRSDQERRASMANHKDASTTEKSSVGPIIATVSCLMATVASGVLIQRLCKKGTSDADDHFNQ